MKVLKMIIGILLLTLALSFTFALAVKELGFWDSVGIILFSTVIIGSTAVGLYLITG